MKFSLLSIITLLTLYTAAQPAKKTVQKQPAPDKTEQMMIQAMKQQGMTQAEIDEAMAQYKQMEPVMKEVQQTGKKGNAYSTGPLKIPVKQVKLLNGIRTLQSDNGASQYIAGLAKEAFPKIATDIKTRADQIWRENNYSKETGMLLFLKGEVRAAVYIMLQTAQKYPENDLVMNNLAFVLAQSGYPHKAIPLQQQLHEKYKNDITGNNMGQSYLALGDTENAKKFFAFGLAKNPNHFEMNCAMGLIEAEKGDPVKANVYIKKVLQKGYTPIAEELAKKTKLKLTFDDIEKPEVPEYFNAYKLKPVRATDNWQEVKQVLAEREAFTEMYRQWYQKREEATGKANTEDLSKIYKEHLGLVHGPFAKKALFMIKLIGEDQIQQLSTRKIMLPYLDKEKELRKAYQDKLDNMYKNASYNNAAEECKVKVQYTKEYLAASKQNHEAAERNILPKYYDWINQSLFWNAFLQSGDAYLATYSGYVHDFIGRLQTFDEYQNLYPTPEYISGTCKDYEQQLKDIKAAELEDEIQSCPLNIKFKAEIASFKVNCKGYEIEGGELAKLSFEKDIKTGEFQVAFGLGIDGDLGFLSAGAKGMMYMRFGSDFSPVDMGALGEAGIEAQLGIINVEEKIKGTMGIGSVNVDAVHHGEEIKLFSADATKDSRDVDASIKPLKKD